MQKFRTKGWRWWSDVKAIFGSSGALGFEAFIPSSTSPPIVGLSQAEEDDTSAGVAATEAQIEREVTGGIDESSEDEDIEDTVDLGTAANAEQDIFMEDQSKSSASVSSPTLTHPEPVETAPSHTSSHSSKQKPDTLSAPLPPPKKNSILTSASSNALSASSSHPSTSSRSGSKRRTLIDVAKEAARAQNQSAIAAHGLKGALDSLVGLIQEDSQKMQAGIQRLRDKEQHEMEEATKYREVIHQQLMKDGYSGEVIGSILFYLDEHPLLEKKFFSLCDNDNEQLSTHHGWLTSLAKQAGIDL